ncbi:SirB2 family protein [Aeromonas schubertii]|uniref:Invasion gene expression up-regulator n=1 Tax=Aeromonas schubertii TaxID=652 RepID=A0A0S2SE49_9GAMM|nr:SirB2 family protein [Aeromonas schubertii]ALP39976.1 invasion gene expression up-regulator [Aeromonas schubertii]
MYPILKHLHLLLVALAVVAFMVRFALLQRAAAPARQARLMRVGGVLNGLVVLSGLALCLLLGLNPINNAVPWLSEKLVCILIAAFLGWMSLSRFGSRSTRWFAFLGALGWVYFAAKLAVIKLPSQFG